MATVLLVRHGRTTANASGLLAGRTPGVLLDDVGQTQVTQAATRISNLPIAQIVSSPLERCRQTAETLAASRSDVATVTVDERLNECDYGEWQNNPLSELAQRDLWKVVQDEPTNARFPGGESIVQMQARAIEAIHEHDARLEAHDVWVAVSHGDIIKSILADAFGMHLDLFQRITVHPASISVVSYGTKRPHVIAMNTDAGELGWLAKQPAGDAPVGGGAGVSPTS